MSVSGINRLIEESVHPCSHHFEMTLFDLRIRLSLSTLRLMSVALRVWCFLLFPLAAGLSLNGTTDSLKILSWNVRNYNLTDRYAHGFYRKNYPKPESEKEALRQVVCEENPDVLLFQEVGGNEFLKELKNDLKQQCDMDYRYFTTLVVEDEVRRLGILSRIPFEEVVNPISEVEFFDYLDGKSQVKRGLLEVRIEVDEQVYHLMTYHLKSRFTTDPRDPESKERREKEARTIRSYILDLLEEDSGMRIIMMGDLNDGVDSQAFNRITKIGDSRILEEVPVLDDHSEAWTYAYARKRSYEQIDFLFVSPYLLDEVDTKLEARIVGGSKVRQASDHRPIVVELQTPASLLPDTVNSKHQ